MTGPYDVIVNGCDNFPTRYLVNDASVWHEIPVVHGSIFRFDGQASTFVKGQGPCYRCVFPEPTPAELAPLFPELEIESLLGDEMDVSASVQLERLDELERAISALDPDQFVRKVDPNAPSSNSRAPERSLSSS